VENIAPRRCLRRGAFTKSAALLAAKALDFLTFQAPADHLQKEYCGDYFS
jgi:hypothetical protein